LKAKKFQGIRELRQYCTDLRIMLFYAPEEIHSGFLKN